MPASARTNQFYSASPVPPRRKLRFFGPLSIFALAVPLTLTSFTPLQAWPAPAPVAAKADQETPTTEKRPNFLIIVADDLGFADVGFNGAQFPTPNIDRLAKMGVKLDRFYTSALCSPTRAGLLTGRYPHRYGIMGDTITPGSNFGLDRREDTIASVLGRAGYSRRAFIGKWHLGHRSRAFHPISFGFTSFYGHYNGAIDYFTHERAGQPDWHRDYTPSGDQGYSTDLMTREAVKIIDTPTPGGNPWMMWVAYNAPHGPLQATPEDLKAAGYNASQPSFGAGRDDGEGGGYGEAGRGNSRRQTAIAMIRALDRGVGAMLEALERTGQLENTVILFTSDNGGPGHWGARTSDEAASNGPLRGSKFQHYEGGVRVAAAIAWPAGLKPRPSADIGPIAYVDLLPTVAHLAGAKLRRPVDGQDVSRQLVSGTHLPQRTLFLGEDYSKPEITGERGPRAPEALRGRAGAVMVGRWKLVGDQLFDIDADPYEKTDLAAQHPEIVRRLAGEVARFAALREVPRQRMNAARLPPIKLWQIPSATSAK